MAKTPCSNAGDLGSILDQGTRSHVPQIKIPCATNKNPVCHKEDQRSLMAQLRPYTPK